MAVTSDDVASFFKKWGWPVVIVVLLIASITLLLGRYRSVLLAMFGISGAHGQSIIFASIFGAMALVMLCIGAILLGIYSPEGGAAPVVWQASRNILATLIGALVGWAVAIMYTPFGDADAARLHSLSQAVTVFASGYLISKFDRFLEKSLFGADDSPSYGWIPMGLGICAFLSTSVMTFEARQYASDPDGVAIRFTAAPNVQLQAGEVKLLVGEDGRLTVAGKDYGPVSSGALVKYVITTQSVYVNGEPIEPVPAPGTPVAGNAATPRPASAPTTPVPQGGQQ